MVDGDESLVPHGNVERPVVVFDGDCGFCRLWIVRWRQRTADRVQYEPFQSPEVSARFPQIPLDDFKRAVHLIEPGGRLSSGALAVFRLLTLGRGPHPSRASRALGTALVGAYERTPGVAHLAETGYRFVAAHRPAFMSMTRILWGPSTGRPTFALSAWCFRRLLGVVYLAAFWSLGVQVIGLFGHDGILPASDYMEQVRAWATEGHVGLDRFREAPTLFWLGASDAWLRGLCLGGVGVAVLLILGLAPLVMLPLLWLFYLSLNVVGRDFLSFQWDALLLEAGFLAIFIAPAVIRDRLRTAADPPRLGIWLLLWLLVRLMIGSGIVKLTSGDPTWRNLTALSFHYETQPIPTPVAWYVHHLPLWLHKASVVALFAVETIVPLFVLGPRRPRLVACLLLVALQTMFAVTGNFAFFNLLTIVLCVLLLDDVLLARLLPTKFGARGPLPDREPDRIGAGGYSGCYRRALLVGVAVVTLPVSVGAFGRSAGIDLAGLPLVADLGAFVSPFRSVNSYGLFAVMTTTRPEIIIEGSDDGETWKAYEFKYKVGDVGRRPPWVAPHQPRVDWQLWFAALGDYSSERWFQRFYGRLLEGSPAVLSLLARDPFEGRPPRYVRGVLYRYRFTDPPTRHATGAWWTRERLGDYSPALSLGRPVVKPDP